MKQKVIFTAVGLAALAAVLFAQEMPRHNGQDEVQHHVKYLTTVLNLTAAQQQQATTIFTNAANNGQLSRDSMKTAHQALETAIKSNDTAGIDQASTQIGSLIGQMMASHAKAEAAFYQILTPEQQTKLNSLQEEGHGHGMMVGPGPMMH